MLETLKDYGKLTIKSTLDRYGLGITKVEPIDLRSTTNDPIAASYLAGDRQFLIEVPLDRCRVSTWGRLGKDSPHPFIRTAKEIASGQCSRFEDSSLAILYAHFTPRSAADRYGVESGTILDNLPPLAAVPPQ